MRRPRWYTPRLNALGTVACATGAVAVIAYSSAPAWGKLLVLALAVALVVWAWRFAAREERLRRQG